MIRNVVLHAANEQPLLMDIYSLPTSSDAGLLCTNLRMMDGKRPVFIDFSNSTFVFPMAMIRFVEVPQAGAEQERNAGLMALSAEPEEAEDLDIDEDFLRKVREA